MKKKIEFIECIKGQEIDSELIYTPNPIAVICGHTEYSWIRGSELIEMDTYEKNCNPLYEELKKDFYNEKEGNDSE
jgi:hypothetical protein